MKEQPIVSSIEKRIHFLFPQDFYTDASTACNQYGSVLVDNDESKITCQKCLKVLDFLKKYREDFNKRHFNPTIN